jgi:murein DD-endopeptidase MepM/ murein hydrolase activator NlpD
VPILILLVILCLPVAVVVRPPPIAAVVGLVPVAGVVSGVAVAGAAGRVPVAGAAGRVPVAGVAGRVPLAADVGRVVVAGVVRRTAARADVLPVPAEPRRYGWPVTPPHVVRRFDPPPRPWLAGHRGVDLSAPPSAVVRAAGAGTVVYAGVIAGRGVVSVAHPGGLRTTYEPVTSALHAGDAVGAGVVLGRLDPGHPGCPAAACLHWGLRQRDRYLDPLALLGLGRVRLLPMAPDPP